MKHVHFLSVFILIVLCCWLSLYAEQKRYDTVIKEKKKLERILLEVVEDTGNKYRIALMEDTDNKKQVIEENFSNAISFFTEYFDTLQERDFWRLYVPMLILVEEDGVLFYHLTLDDSKNLKHIWTDKMYFNFPDECGVGMKKVLMTECLEQQASEIITKHNVIASQYGIGYRFFLPRFFQDTSGMPEFPMLFIVLQGWPLNDSHTVFYNACIDAGMLLRLRQEDEILYPKTTDGRNLEKIEITGRNVLNYLE